MAKKRIDFGGRIAGDKAKLSDEFITKSQLVTPDGNALETLANGDLVVPAATSDHLVLVDELDTNPGTLLDKIYPAGDNVTISVVEIEGERVMEIGVADSGGSELPIGAASQTLRHNGTDWIATNKVRVNPGVVNGVLIQAEENVSTFGRSDIGVFDNSGLRKISIVTSDNYSNKSNTIELLSQYNANYMRIITDSLRILNGADNTGKYFRIKDTTGEIEFVDLTGGGGLPDGTETGQLARWDGVDWVAVPEAKIITGSGNASMSLKNTRAALVLDCNTYNTGDVAIAVLGGGLYRFTILQNGQIKAAALAGTGNRPLYADSNGNIKAQTGATGTFTSQDGKTVTVTNGIITSIV